MTERPTPSPMKGFKGFDKDMKCSPNGNTMQYAVGETYVHAEDVELCVSGYHFCEHPLDCLKYYSPCDSRYAVVEADEVSAEKDYDSKRVARSLRIVSEIDLKCLIEAGVEFIREKPKKSDKTGGQAAASDDWGQAAACGIRGQAAASGESGQAVASGNTGQAAASGYRGQAVASGNMGQAVASGNMGQAVASGNMGQAAATGQNSFAISTGVDGRASGALGCWLVLAEWRRDESSEWWPVDVRTVKVDGTTIKPNTSYRLKDGQFIEVVES